MYCVYVLRSLKNGKRYVGITGNTADERLRQHNAGANQWTRHNRPFELRHKEDFTDKTAALRRERFLKSGHGREYLNTFIPR